MDEDDAFFQVDQEEEQIRQIVTISHSNLPYEPKKTQKSKVALKMIQIPKEELVEKYVPFKLHKNESEIQNDQSQIFKFDSPFSQYYDKDQMIFQKLQNEQFNKHKEILYFAGLFIPRNLFSHYLKDDSNSLDIMGNEEYESRRENLIQRKGQNLVFDSNFESGNLFAAFKVGRFQYDLVMQNDTNSKGTNQWFYFSVQAMKQNQQYTLNIVNFCKNDSLFNYGMMPVLYSTVGKQKTGADWVRKGKDVSYYKCELQREASTRHYYKLTFTISTKFQKDKLYIAHSYPYTFSKLNDFIGSLVQSQKDFVTKVEIGKTVGKKSIPALIISHPIGKRKDSRKAIIIMARQHPGQTQGSFMCEGVINKLLQKGKEGEYLRKNYVIYVIPMVNIDGVVFGHYRTNLLGKDLNRKWDSTEKETSCPQVISIKAFLSEISKSRDIRFILDLHGHSKKMNSFFYGNPHPENPELVRIFPYICSRLNEAIEFMDCTFAMEEYKKKAARVFLSFYCRQIQVYTFEASFYGFINNGKKEEFTPQTYKNLGKTLMEGLYCLLENEIKVTQAAEFHLSKSPVPKDQSFKTPLLMKYWKELKENKILLGVGEKFDSGSDSKPEEGEVNINQIRNEVKEEVGERKELVNDRLVSKRSVRFSKKKVKKEGKEVKELIKPHRTKVMIISQVNAVLPDKYHMGLQPIKRRQIMLNQNEVAIQTQPVSHLDYPHYSSFEIKGKLNLVQENRSLHSRRHSELIPNFSRNAVMFKVDLFEPVNERPIQKKPRFQNIYTQTIITFQSKQLSGQRSIKKIKLVDEKYQNYLSKLHEIKLYDFDVRLKTKKFVTIDPSPIEKELTLSTPPLSIQRKEIGKK